MTYINFSDCAYNYKSGKIVINRRDMYFRYALAIPYHEHAKPTGKFGKYIKKLFKGDRKTMREVRKCFGLALSNIRYLNLAFMFYGNSSGTTGMVMILTG